MAIIKIKRGAGVPVGLTFGELAFDVANQRLYFGITGSSILINSGSTSVVTSFNGLTGSVTGVSTFNGLTGNVTGVTTGTTNTFGPLQSFTTGISAGGFTLTAGNMYLINGVTINGAGFGTIPSPATIRLSGADLDLSDTSTIQFNSAFTNFNTGTINLGTATVNGSNIVNSVGPQGGSGLTGAVSIGAGTLGGVSVTSSGKIVQINNTGVRFFNGATGIVSGVGSVAAGTAISVSGATGAVTIGNQGVHSITVSAGLLASGSTGAITITDQGVRSLSAGSFINLSGTTGTITANNAGVWTFNGATGTVSGVGSVAAGTAISVSGSTGSITIGNQGVQSITVSAGLLASGSTGAITITDQGVRTFNGLTGTVSGVGGVAAGTGISVSGATGSSITIGNQGVLSFNGLTGAVSGVTTSVANTFTALQTFSVGISGAGATFGGQVNAQNLRLLTIGGDEGGQLDFGLPVTNTSLTGGVAIDVYQNRLRIFENGGTSRGYYVDLTSGGAGASTLLGAGAPGPTGPTGAAGADGQATSDVAYLLFQAGVI